MTDEEIARVLEGQDEEYQRLGREHKDLKERLIAFKERVYLSPEEEAEKKGMQKQKLQRKDRMAEMIRQYRESVSLN